MAQAIRHHDWMNNSLGPIEGWPSALKTTVNLIIASGFPQCIVWGPDHIAIPNDAFLPLLGKKPAALGLSFRDIWAEAWDVLSPIVDRAYAGEATFIEKFRMLTDRSGEMEEAFFTFSYSPIRDEDGVVRGMLDTVVDVTPTVRADRELRTANGELGHRLKNVLAVTQAVALQTIRRSTSLDQARDGVAERLSALGRATDVLTASSWEAAELHALIHGILTVYGRDRILVKGPQIRLPSRLAIALALTLHELATNAAKYGALSNERGRVDLAWRISPGPDAEDARFMLQWKEYDGPAVSIPTRRGFGTNLIERTLASSFKGKTLVDYRPEGLSFTLDAPMKELDAEPETGR